MSGHSHRATRANSQPSPTLYGSITFTHLEENSIVWLSYHTNLKTKEETRMSEESSHVKQLSLSHVCQIHSKKSLTIFPSPAGMSLAGKNLIIPGGEFGL
jgi:hypothetical protein